MAVIYLLCSPGVARSPVALDSASDHIFDSLLTRGIDGVLNSNPGTTECQSLPLFSLPYVRKQLGRW